MLGGKCVRCGFSDWRALCFDHINGDGNKERTFKSSHTTLRRVLKGRIEGIQLLCYNCNQIKKIENNECAKSKWIADSIGVRYSLIR